MINSIEQRFVHIVFFVTLLESPEGVSTKSAGVIISESDFSFWSYDNVLA